MPDLSSLTTAHRQILYLIHESRQAYYNRLKKKAHTENGMSNTTVITALKRLQEEDMIQIIEEDKKERTRGRAKKIYKPTLRGIILLMRENPELWFEIDSLAYEYQSVLPLIFGKWHLYQETQMFSNQSNFEKYIEEMKNNYTILPESPLNSLSTILTLKLHDVFNSKIAEYIEDSELLCELITYIVLFTLEKPWHEPELCLNPYTLFFKNYQFNTVKQLWERAAFGDTPREVIFMTVVSKDQDLKTYFTNQLVAQKTYYQQMQSNLVKTERLWRGVLSFQR